jgi:hypothetical protein
MRSNSCGSTAIWLIWIVVATVCLSAAEPLAVVNAAIRQMEDGAPLPPGFTYTPGDILFFSFQVSGYQAAEDKVHVSYQIDALDPKGVRLMEPIKGAVEATLAPQDKNWMPKVHPEIAIPPLAGSGTYKIVARVHDEVAKTDAMKEVSFSVRGHEVAPSDTLAVRNFLFYRSESDPRPLENAVYRAGDAIWARFDIIGYKLGEGNNVEVSYGIAVLNEEGKVLYSQDQAAVEKGGSFYPKRYVPGQMSLTTQSNMRKGDYYIVVKVDDRVGDQKSEAKEKFTVE